ncbi:vesicle-fusing ATPase domain protein [Mycobacterium xenopi 3993]|nr:vesicle-fusing ATPase domain protein [Mycobacterium xenopi 3993]
MSVQPNSSVTWGTGVPEAAPEPTARRVAVDDLKGVHPQVAKLTEWLKLALDEPHLLQTLGASPHLGVLVSGRPGGQGDAGARGVRRSPAGRTRRPGDRRAGRRRPAQGGDDGDRNGARRRRGAADHRRRRAAARHRRAGGHLDPGRAARAGGHQRCRVRRHLGGAGPARHPAARPDLCDRELVVPLPDAATRAAQLAALLRSVPTRDLNFDEIASRTPGFVVADLAALVREAALRAAARASADGKPPP